MKSFLIILLKVVVAIAVGVAIVHLWPVTIVPMFAALLLLAVLSPVWFPVLLILGIIWIVRRLCGIGRRSTTA